LYAEEPAAIAALRALFEHCAMTHKHWGDGCNRKEANAAEKAGRDALAAWDAGKAVAEPKPVGVRCAGCDEVRPVFTWVPGSDGYEHFPACSAECEAALKAAGDPDDEDDKPYADSLSGPVTAFHRSLGRAMVCEPIPDDYPVRPLDVDEPAKDRKTCGYCGWSWDDAIVTGMTPAPGARCPFESFHRPEMVEAGKAVRS
jgi:hypothetical protein